MDEHDQFQCCDQSPCDIAAHHNSSVDTSRRLDMQLVPSSSWASPVSGMAFGDGAGPNHDSECSMCVIEHDHFQSCDWGMCGTTACHICNATGGRKGV